MSSESTGRTEANHAEDAELQAIIEHDFKVLTTRYSNQWQPQFGQLHSGAALLIAITNDTYNVDTHSVAVLVIRALAPLESTDNSYQIAVIDGEESPTVLEVHAVNRETVNTLLSRCAVEGVRLYAMPPEEPRYALLMEAIAAFEPQTEHPQV